MVEAGAKYINVYGICDNKCKVPVVSREEIETEYFNNKKILFCDSSATFSSGAIAGNVTFNIEALCREYGITLTKNPRVIPICYTSGVCLSVNTVTVTKAIIDFRAISGTINYLKYGVMVIVQ